MNLILLKDEIENHVQNYLQLAVTDNEYNYSTFGKVAEPLMAKGIKDYFIKNFSFSNSDFKEAKGKNDFPDLDFIKIKTAIEFKCAKADSNPGNDMGTLNSWPAKIKRYGDNIFYLFVSYDEIDGMVEIQKVFFNKFYNFIGVIQENILKYREKDGNLRPKSWDDFYLNKAYFTNLEDFTTALERTNEFRSARIVNKHIQKMNISDLQILHFKLHKMFSE